jgi:two-component system response regulator YesN
MSKGNLLIVDDEPFILKTLKYSLSDYADNVFTANNGKEALEIIATSNIHCVVCDINMPVMTGIQVIRKLREEKNDVPLIFYTGHGNNELMKEAVRFGVFDFLNKPDLDGIEEVVVKGLKAGLKELT